MVDVVLVRLPGKVALPVIHVRPVVELLAILNA
jgi:hypothetical protein